MVADDLTLSPAHSDSNCVQLWEGQRQAVGRNHTGAGCSEAADAPQEAPESGGKGGSGGEGVSRTLQPGSPPQRTPLSPAPAPPPRAEFTRVPVGLPVEKVVPSVMSLLARSPD